MDDELRQRLAELGEIAATLDPSTAEDQESAARIEAYREGIRFAVAFIEDDGDAPDDTPGTGVLDTGYWDTGNWDTGNWDTGNWDTRHWDGGELDSELESGELPQIPLPREE